MKNHEPSFADRQNVAAKARQDLLAKARKKNPANDPDFAARQAERAARAEAREARQAERRAAKEAADAARAAARKVEEEARQAELEARMLTNVDSENGADPFRRDTFLNVRLSRYF